MRRKTKEPKSSKEKEAMAAQVQIQLDNIKMEMTIVAAPTPINKSGAEQHPNGSTAAIDDNAENGEGTSSKSRSPITELKLHQRFGIPMQAMNGESDEEEVPHSTKSLKPVDLMGTGPLISRKVTTVNTKNGPVGALKITVRAGRPMVERKADSGDESSNDGRPFSRGNKRNESGSNHSERQLSAGGSSALEVAPKPGQPALVKIQARKVNCKSSDGEMFQVDWYLMQQSKLFKRTWEEHRVKRKGGNNGRSRKFTFTMDVKAKTFERVLDWLKEHDGMDDPVVAHDPATGDRICFELTEFEKRFFDQPVHVMSELLTAGKTLDIPSLYLFGCQSMARLIQEKSPAEIREMLGLENDLTPTEIASIRRRNRKFRMRELKAARYVDRMQQLQQHVQRLSIKGKDEEKRGLAVAEHMLLATGRDILTG